MAQRLRPPPATRHPALGPRAVYVDGTGWVLRKDACLRGGAGDTSSGRSRNDRHRRRRVTRARAAGRAAHTRRRRASLRALRWGPGIIASPVGFPDRGFLIGLGGSLGSSLGIKLNIWTLSLSPPFFFLQRSLRQNQEAEDPYLLVDWKKEEENRKLRSTSHLSERAFFLVHPRVTVTTEGRIYRTAASERRGLEERSPDYPSLGPSGGAFLPTLLGARPPPCTPCCFKTRKGGHRRLGESSGAPWAVGAP